MKTILVAAAVVVVATVTDVVEQVRIRVLPTAGTCAASTAGELAACAASYTEGDTITVTANITLTSAVTFANGGFTLTAATECGVTLSHNAGAVSLLTVTRDLTHDTVIKHIRFAEGASHTNGSYLAIDGAAAPATDYNPVLVHDNCVDLTDGNLLHGIDVRTVGGALIYSNVFTATGPGNSAGGGRANQAINFTADSATSSWTTAHTMGTADTDGLQNTYVEDNEFIQFVNQAIDTSANSRVVFRYNTMNESAGAAHGADTSPHGMRHVEYYNNIFIHDYQGDAGTGCTLTFPVSRALNIRGGTAVIVDNNFDAVEADSCWGTNQAKTVIMEIQNLARASAQYPCWGAAGSGTAYADSVYPAYHQVGRGTYNGSVALTSTGELDPLYFSGNSNSALLGMTNYEVTCGGSVDDITGYIQVDRDYYLSARPSYTKYTYPHPLRTP